MRTPAPSSTIKNPATFGTVMWLLLAATLSPLSYAHAYLDPGTGSYAIQIAIGVIFGGVYTLRNFGSRLFSRLRHRQNDKNKPEA